jgi:hypothetical protein
MFAAIDPSRMDLLPAESMDILDDRKGSQDCPAYFNPGTIQTSGKSVANPAYSQQMAIVPKWFIIIRTG